MAIRNLYSGLIDREGVALWSVTWSQYADLNIFDAEGLDDLKSVQLDWDLAPADGVIDSQQIVYLWSELMSAYGNLNVSSSAATAVAVAGTYVKAAGTTALNLSSDMDMPQVNRLRHTGTVAKPFFVSASASVLVSADAKVTLALAKNGTVDEHTAIEQKCTLAGGAEAFSIKSLVSLDENDYVEVWLTADNTVNVTLEKLHLIAAAA